MAPATGHSPPGQRGVNHVLEAPRPDTVGVGSWRRCMRRGHPDALAAEPRRGRRRQGDARWAGLTRPPSPTRGRTRPTCRFATDAGACTPSVTCDPPNGRYCGTIGNGCFGMIDCGSCAADEVCDSNVCVGGASCVRARLRRPRPGNYCGTVGNGCGRAMDCGACDSSLVCATGVCVPGAGCTPLTCTTATGRYCGTIGDGCGGTLHVRRLSRRLDLRRRGRREHLRPHQLHGRDLHGGGRRALLRQHRRRLRADAGLRRLHRDGQVCTSNVCRTAGCVPLTCNAGVSRYCGVIGDGCGGSLDCGDVRGARHLRGARASPTSAAIPTARRSPARPRAAASTAARSATAAAAR